MAGSNKRQAGRGPMLSSGEVAEYCQVHPRTVLRWINRGLIKAYSLPGRGNKRIQARELLNFLLSHDLPVPDRLASLLEITGADSQADLKKDVLIVDDDVHMARSIARMFTRTGYQCHLAHDGFAAGALLQQIKPRILTLDLQMPRLSGFEVLKYIRSQTEFSGLKIIVISALAQSHKTEILAAGADFCIEKPFIEETLMDCVNTDVTACI